MVCSLRLIGAASFALAVAAAVPAAEAQRGPSPALHARAKHKPAKPKEEGRQITVHKQATPSWLTLGGGAEVGHGNNYVVDTFNQPSPVEGTFAGYRGRERVIDQFGVPGVPLFRF
jgi:hypothetical protein